ncbi:MAG: DUF192 domain-containing protein [Myxococcales bacterium]|nr:DUF192 domain-containing protein [Myxococcales bacterium]
MKSRLALASAALVALGCGRSEEPAGSRPAKAAPVVVASPGPRAASAPSAPPTPPPSPSAVADKPRCVVPSPATPQPRAEKAKNCPADPTGNLPLGRGHVTFADAPGSPRVEVELADRPETRERGLMYRTGMPDDAGMLFSWPNEQVRSFWMHNTCIPLDMLFIDARGFIVGILEQVPTMNDESRSIPCPAAHVLELNAGWTRAHGITAGQRLRIEP